MYVLIVILESIHFVVFFTLCLIPSTFSFSIGTTELGGRPFSNCMTVLAYFITWLLKVSGLRSSNAV